MKILVPVERDDNTIHMGHGVYEGTIGKTRKIKFSMTASPGGGLIISVGKKTHTINFKDILLAITDA